MKMKRSGSMKKFMILSALLVLGITRLSVAGEPGCCAECGCHCNVKKVCRLVCEEKEIKEVKWDCECEDFCVPGKSEVCCEKCKCDPSKPCCKDCEKIWNPSRCADLYTRKILIKKEVPKKVPSYKWVVEYVCCECGCEQSAGDCAVPTPEEAAPTPTPQAAKPNKGSKNILAEFRSYFAE
jgi:hypothetical protein